MTQQQWGGQPPRGQFGRQFGNAPQGWSQPAPAQDWIRTPQQPFGGQPTWQGQPGPQGQGPRGRPPVNLRPPQRNPLRRVLVAVMALVAAALVGLVVVNLTTGGSGHTVAYQNDNYKVPPPDKNPPPLPAPQTEQQAEQLIKNNKLYNQKMPLPVRCELKPITTQSTDAELQTHLNNLMACLVRAWEPPVAAAGYKIVRPTVTIYGDSVTTKCGKSAGGNAFYCGADQQVYYSRTLPDAIADLKGSPWGPDVVLAHEFGHAIQARTGILVSADGLEQQAGTDSAAGLEISRRIEQQADCFSGLFLHATSQSLGIKQSDVPAMEVIYVAIGDDTLTRNPNIESTHGHGVDRLYWARQGLGNSAINKCNTFAAPASRVK